jgi:hypothetical protein
LAISPLHVSAAHWECGKNGTLFAKISE